MTSSRVPGHRLFVLIPLVMLLPGCDGERISGEGDLEELPRLSAEAVTRIGDLDDPDVGFSRVGAVDVDEDGHVYVLEASVPEIRVYDERGSLLRRIGGRGSGPGEFEGVPRFGVVGDTVWTVSVSQNRISLFDRQGSVLATGRTEGVAVPLPNGFGYVLPWSMRSDGRFSSHFARVAARPDDPPTGVRRGDGIPVPIVLFDAAGAVTDTIGWAAGPPPRMWRPPEEEDPPWQFLDVEDRRFLVPSPPTTLPWWEALPDGYLRVETPLAESQDEGEVGVTRFGLNGDTVYHRTLRYRPIEYSSADLDSIAARGARGEGGAIAPAGESPAVPDNVDAVSRRLRAAMDFPEFRLPIETVWLAQDESVWLRLSNRPSSDAVWVVVGPQGDVRGRLELPVGARVLWSEGDAFWAVEPDEHEVPWLVRYDLRPT